MATKVLVKDGKLATYGGQGGAGGGDERGYFRQPHCG